MVPMVGKSSRIARFWPGMMTPLEERERERETERDTERDTEREIESERYRQRWTERELERGAYQCMGTV